MSAADRFAQEFRYFGCDDGIDNPRRSVIGSPVRVSEPRPEPGEDFILGQNRLLFVLQEA